MASWYQSNSDKRNARTQAVARENERQSASEPRAAFQMPGFPLEVVPLRTLPVPRTLRTAPKRLTRRPDLRSEQRARRAARMAADARRHAARARQMRYVSRSSKILSGGLGLAFQFGWELGDHLFPHGLYDLLPASGALTKWTHPDYCYYECPAGPAGALKGFKDSNTTGTVGVAGGCGIGTNQCLPPNTVQNVNTAGSLATPEITTSNPISALADNPRNGFDGHVYATWWPVPPGTTPDVDLWVAPRPAVPAVKAPLAPAWPSEFPDMAPIGRPTEFPYPQRWRDAVPPPEFERGTGTTTRTDSPSRSVPAPMTPFPITFVVPHPEVDLRPPDIVFDVPTYAEPGGGGRTRRPTTKWRRNSERRKKPPKHTRQRKVTVGTVAGKFWVMLNLATELNDVIDSMNKGLPKRLRAKPTGGDHPEYGYGIGKPMPHHVMQAVWENWDQWSAKKFLAAFIENQVEDVAYGTIGQVNKKGYGATANSSTGITGIQNNEVDSTLALPTMSYDETTRVWTVGVPYPVVRDGTVGIDYKKYSFT